MIKEVTIIDDRLVGNTRYHLHKLEEIPFKYLKWLAHSQYSDQKVKDYYLSIKLKDPTECTCIHCKEVKTINEMVPQQKSWHIEGLLQKSNVCQNCYDKNLALTSARELHKSLGKEFIESNISQDFINAKIQLTRIIRIVNKNK